MTEQSVVARLRHELRTPLNHIIGYSELLLEELGEQGRPELVAELQRVHGDAMEILGLINSFLTPGRLETDPPDLRRLACEVSSSLDRIIAAGATLRAHITVTPATDLLPDLERISSAAERLVALLREGVAPAAVAVGATATTEAPVDRPPAVARSIAPATILVVDDNESNREMLARRLRRQGHEVRIATGGHEALDELAAGPVDLVLLDVMMPDLDGYTVLQRVKANERLRDIPVLMISALDELDSAVRCIELGADDYLSKPFDPVLLQARIGACLEKKRLRDQEVQHLRELSEWNRTLEQRVQEQVAQVERLGRLKRFFSPQLAELIVAGGAEDPLKTHRREVTVVFLDLRGFTAFTETAEPEELMGVLREYQAEMGKLILAHEGTLERFTGDGMMVFFNDPVPVANHAERAIRMAVEMRDRVGVLATRWRKQGYALEFGVGIARGYATIGAIGFEGRWDYGAIGTVTNLAARLCVESKPGQILIAQRVYGAVDELVEVEPMGELLLRGFLRPIPVFNVLGLRSSQGAAAESSTR